MYVIVNISGKQFRAEKGQELKVPHQKEETGKKVSFDHVLLIDNGKGISLGKPTVSGSKVEATILKHGRDKKVPVFKKKEFTLIRVDDIKIKTSKKKTAKKKTENEVKGD